MLGAGGDFGNKTLIPKKVKTGMRLTVRTALPAMIQKDKQDMLTDKCA
jgi:hypothetical protein